MFLQILILRAVYEHTARQAHVAQLQSLSQNEGLLTAPFAQGSL